MTCHHCHRDIEESDKDSLELASESLGTLGVFCSHCLTENREGILKDIRKIVMSIVEQSKGYACPGCGSRDVELNEAEDDTLYFSWLRCRACGERKILGEIRKGENDDAQDQDEDTVVFPVRT